MPLRDITNIQTPARKKTKLKPLKNTTKTSSTQTPKRTKKTAPKEPKSVHFLPGLVSKSKGTNLFNIPLQRHQQEIDALADQLVAVLSQVDQSKKHDYMYYAYHQVIIKLNLQSRSIFRSPDGKYAGKRHLSKTVVTRKKFIIQSFKHILKQIEAQQQKSHTSPPRTPIAILKDAFKAILSKNKKSYPPTCLELPDIKSSAFCSSRFAARIPHGNIANNSMIFAATCTPTLTKAKKQEQQINIGCTSGCVIS